MKRSLLAILLCSVVGLPALAQNDPPNPEEQVRQRTEEQRAEEQRLLIQELLEEAEDQLEDAKLEEDLRDEVNRLRDEMRQKMQQQEEALRALLINGQADQKAIEELFLQLNQVQEGGIVVRPLQPVELLDVPQLGVVFAQNEGIQNAKDYIDPHADQTRDQVIALLDHQDYAMRQSAEAHLLTDNTLDRGTLRQLVTQSKSDEQRFRLIRVAEHHIMRIEREASFGGDQPVIVDRFNRVIPAAGAIGFSYMPELTQPHPLTGTPGVVVTATMPGFPGHAHLRPGDLVVAIDGRTARPHTNVTSWLSDTIGSHAPGEDITVTIVRDEQLVRLHIACAQAQALGEMYTSNGRDAAFRERPYSDIWRNAQQQLTQDLPKPKALVPIR